MTGFEALQQLRLPDAWQAEAIRALVDGDDVIVQVHPGLVGIPWVSEVDRDDVAPRR